MVHGLHHAPTLACVSHHDVLLRRSFLLAHEARAAGNHPFGALLAVDGVVVAEAQNQVNTGHDITAHAETVLVRTLEQAGDMGLLSGGTVFASCEPCPMCVGAMFWAGARHVVYGLSSARLMELSTPPGGEPIRTFCSHGRGRRRRRRMAGPCRTRYPCPGTRHRDGVGQRFPGRWNRDRRVQRLAAKAPDRPGCARYL